MPSRFTGEVLFHTVHGSHLYGTSHAGSDRDYFTVYSNVEGRSKARNAKQGFAVNELGETTDTMKTDLSTFMLYCQQGVPQYLEALYSRVPTVDALGQPFRLSFTPTLGEAMNKYRRTINAFYEQDDYKHRRHAWRLWFNMNAIGAGVVFNPELSQMQLEYIDHMIDRHPLEHKEYPHAG